MKYQDLNRKIIDLVGGRENIEAVVHCMTRLRFTLKDRNKADTKAIKEINDVIDVVDNKVSYQIIIGTQVTEVYDELVKMLGIEENENSSESTDRVKKGIVKSILDVVSEAMTPLLEPIICAGLLAALLSIIALTGLMSANSPTYKILESLQQAVFYFLPIFMAMSVSKRLGASPYLAVALAGTLLSQTINGVKGLHLLGIALPTITYSNSFIPILIAVWAMGYVTKFINKIVPDVLKYFLSPVLIMLIMLPATLLVFGPIGYYLGMGLIGFFNLLLKYVGAWLVMLLYAGLQPFLITLGAGNFIMPIVAQLIASNGFDPAFISSCTISDIGVAGAMLGYFLKARDMKQKGLLGTVTLSAILGVTEPAIFGVFVKYRRPYLAVLIGGGLGGLFAGLTGVKAYSIAWGLFGLPAYIGNGNFKNFVLMVSAVVISFVASGVASYILGFPKTETPEEKKEEKILEGKISALQSVALSSVVSGELIPIANVKDEAFSTGALGKGIGIIPTKNTIYSPVDGEIITLFPTQHALGLKAECGAEILIHIGIDTVQLNGKYFNLTVKQGDKVKKGQKIGEVDFKGIRSEGYDPTVMVIITNTKDFLDVIPEKSSRVTFNDQSLNIVLN